MQQPHAQVVSQLKLCNNALEAATLFIEFPPNLHQPTPTSTKARLRRGGYLNFHHQACRTIRWLAIKQKKQIHKRGLEHAYGRLGLTRETP